MPEIKTTTYRRSSSLGKNTQAIKAKNRHYLSLSIINLTRILSVFSSTIS